MSKIAQIMQQAAAGSAAGAESTAIEDVFSTYLYTGNGTFQTINNGIALKVDGTLGGSVLLSDNSGGYTSNPAGFDFGSAAELAVNDFTVEGFIRVTNNLSIVPFGAIGDYQSGIDIRIYPSGPYVYFLNGTYGPSPSLVTNKWYHVAVVRSGTNLYIYVNGKREVSATVATTTLPTTGGSAGGIPSGATDSCVRYMSNFRISNIARYTSASFDVPTQTFTSDANTLLLTFTADNPTTDASSYARTLTLDTAGGGTATPDSSFGPFPPAGTIDGGMVWLKARTAISPPILYDTERGASNHLFTSSTNAEAVNAQGLYDFSSTGFSVGNYDPVNRADPFVSWTFRKAPRFFDCIKYSGDGVFNRSVTHNLGVAPAVIIVKRTNSNSDWAVYHKDLDNTAPSNYSLNLNTSSSRSYTEDWGDGPTDTIIRLGTGLDVNASGSTYVAYLFADDPLGPSGDGSDGLIACGRYTGNGSTNGPEIDLGWEPQWVMIKRTNGAGNWHMFDIMRGIPTGGNDPWLNADETNAENPNSPALSVTPTGFKLEDSSGGWNGAADTYIYIAIRRGPMRVPTSGTEVFAITQGSGSDPSFSAGITVDMGLAKEPSTSTLPFRVGTRLLQGTYLETGDTGAEAAGASYQFDYQDAWHSGSLGSTWYSWNFKRAPGFFDVVAYTGDGISGSQKPHNLGVVPEIVLIKRRDALGNWLFRLNLGAGASSTEYLRLHETTALLNGASRDYTDTYFTETADSSVNASGGTYIAYLFASLDGVSKVGSFTTNGSGTTNVDCGFTSGARFVLAKKTDGTSGWYVWDTARGILSSGADPYLELNTSAAEVGGNDFLEPYAQGFTVQESNWGTGNWIFLAIA